MHGPCKSIDEAVEQCPPNCNIFLAEGVYTLTKAITKPGLIFERLDNNKEVYIVGNKGPCVNVVLAPDEVVVFKKIIVMHSGLMMETLFKENSSQEPKYRNKADKRAIQEFEIHPKVDCLFFIHSGRLNLKDCTLTFKSLPKKLKSKLTMIIARPGAALNMSNCDCTGNEHNHDAAIMLINANAIISNCRFISYGAGVIFTIAKPDNEVVIQDNNITDSMTVGIYV